MASRRQEATKREVCTNYIWKIYLIINTKLRHDLHNKNKYKKHKTDIYETEDYRIKRKNKKQPEAL